MTTATKTRASTAAGAVDLEEARQTLAALEEEAAGLDEAIAVARAGGMADTFLRLDVRREQLPGEIAAARRSIVVAEIEPAKARALATIAEFEKVQADAEAERSRLHQERERLDADRRSIPVDDEDRLADAAAADARLRARFVTADNRVRDARQQLLAALFDLDVLEDRARDEFGRQREPGPGVLALPSWPLAKSVHVHGHPVTGESVQFVAGTPADQMPRWALAQLDSYERHFRGPEVHPFVSTALDRDRTEPITRQQANGTNNGAPYTTGQTVAAGQHADRCFDRGATWPTQQTTPVIERLLQTDGTIATIERADCDRCINRAVLRRVPPWGRAVNVFQPADA